jgi:hypothetical protein
MGKDDGQHSGPPPVVLEVSKLDYLFPRTVHSYTTSDTWLGLEELVVQSPHSCTCFLRMKMAFGTYFDILSFIISMFNLKAAAMAMHLNVYFVHFFRLF